MLALVQYIVLCFVKMYGLGTTTMQLFTCLPYNTRSSHRKLTIRFSGNKPVFLGLFENMKLPSLFTSINRASAFLLQLMIRQSNQR